MARQFGRPSGPLGRLAGWAMAHRPSNRARIVWTLERLQIEPDHRVLELGFGPGYAISLVAPRLTAGCVIGLDHSAVMLAQARRRNAAWIADGRVQLVLGGLESLATLPPGFDRVFSANVLQFVPDRNDLWRQLLAILDSGGQVATTYQPRHRGATDDDARRYAARLVAEMQTAGFVDCRIEENPRFGVLAVCVLGHAP